MQRLGRFLRDDCGAETAEWILMVAIIVGIGLSVLVGILQPELTDTIADSIKSATSP